MKKIMIASASGFMLLVLSSCFHHRHDLSITIDDDDREYEMDARFTKNRTREVQVYLNDRLLDDHAVAVNKRYSGEEVTLDDNTTFYINAYPGSLHIRIDKEENSPESYEKVRQVCEELKDILAGN